MIFFKKIVCLLFLFPTVALAQQIEIPEGWSDGYVYANKVRLHYYRATAAPDKPVMVMVHGVTGSGLSWTRLAQQFQGFYDIYMLDARGHGFSDPFYPGDDGETLINDVVGFIRAMKFDKPILVGHSMGAATVMRLAADNPDVGRAVIMLDPLLGMRIPKSRPAARGVSVPEAQERITVNMFGDPETLVRQNNYSTEDLKQLARRQNSHWHETDVMYWAFSQKQYHGPYTEEAEQAMTGTMDIGNSLTKIVIPALILKADAPREVREKNEGIAAEMKNGQLLHIEGAGHNVHHDKLERTAEAMWKFLRSL